jgi:hypothetical protein
MEDRRLLYRSSLTVLRRPNRVTPRIVGSGYLRGIGLWWQRESGIDRG